MTIYLRRVSLTTRLVVGLMLALATLGPTFSPAATVLAAPASGGTFTVTSAADTATSDGALTLREALLVARGGTGLSGLNRAASAGEQAVLAGCTFSAGLITGGCGPGIANSIVFSGSLGVNPTITLTSALPPIDNSAPTALDGSVHAVYPVIAAGSLPGGSDGLLISSNGNRLQGLTVSGAPRDDLRLTGNSNQVLSETVLLKAGAFGLHLAGGLTNTVAETGIGAASVFPFIGFDFIAYLPTCGSGNGQGGLLLDAGAAGNTITETMIACSSGVGARFDGASHNVLEWSGVVSQTGNGLELINGAAFNTVYAEQVVGNSQYGVLFSGAATQANFLGVDYNHAAAGLNFGVAKWTTIVRSGRAALRLEAGANQNLLQGLIIGLNTAPNNATGVEIDSAPNNQMGTAFHNVVFQNDISYSFGAGIVITDSPGTAIGSGNQIGNNGGAGLQLTNSPGADLQPLIVSANGGPGIVVNATTGASLEPTYVISNTGPGIELINTSNTPVLPYLVVKNSGAGIAVVGNAATGNLLVPSADYGNGGVAIDLGNDGHTANGAHSPPGPNDWLPYPVALLNIPGDITVITGTACANCAVLIYAASGNAAANGGGGNYLQGTVANGAGNWSTTLIDGYSLGGVALQACSAPCAFGSGIASSHSDTSEIGPSLAGRFVVTSNGDGSASDGSLTLREALLAARGGTGASGLNRPASATEQGFMGGCVFDGGGHITGGCGPGINDTVVFSAGLGVHPVITLTAALPALADSMPTRVDGTMDGVLPIVNASGVVSDGLLLASNANAVTGLTVRGAPQDDLLITGNRNQVLTGTLLIQAGHYGLHIQGGISNSVSLARVGACGQGNGQGGILLDASASNNAIGGAVITCNSGPGVRMDGPGVSHNNVSSATISSQTGNGIEIVNGANNIGIGSSVIISNALDGILLTGAATSFAFINQNLIGVTAAGAAAGNGRYGIEMSAGTHGSQVGFFCFPCAQQTISGNGLGGIRVDSGAHDNTLSGYIGLNAAGTAAVPNHGPGVSFDSAPSNTVGLFTAGFGRIGGNLGPGVLISNSNNIVVGTGLLDIGPGNSGPGVEIVNSSNDIITPLQIESNTGAGIAVVGNGSVHNFLHPAVDANNGGLAIDLGNDGHTPNGAHSPPGPNDWLPFPVMTAVSGNVVGGTTCLSCTVYIYQAVGNPTAPGGGGGDVQQAQADAAGHWQATLTAGLTPYTIAFQACQGQCSSVLGNFASDTSELSPVYHALWLPLMRR